MMVLWFVGAVLFWLGTSLLLYVYVVYPVFIWLASLLFGRKAPRPSVSETDLPFVSLLIAAYNEEKVIAQRIHNALASDYPADRFEVVIASDGSTDRTNSIVQEAIGQTARVRLFAYPERAGKTAVLNRSIPRVRGDVVALSDANTFTDASALRNLAAWFSRPETGVVCGQLLLVDARDGRNADGLYWRFENFLKTCEGKLGALLGANGAIYAIRRSFFQPVPAETLVDDFVIPLSTKIRTGCEIVYEPRARAIEETAQDLRTEFRRRARIGTGGFQCIAAFWHLVNPVHGWLAMAFLSHKVLRWLGPFFLLSILLGNVLLLGGAFYRSALVVQAAAYLVAVLGRSIPGSSTSARLARLPALFAGVNLALLVGFWRWIRQRGASGVWERTGR